MVRLDLSSDKELEVASATAMYAGENKFEQIQINIPPVVSGNNVSDYNIELHVINKDNEYFTYNVKPLLSGKRYIATIDVMLDLTDEAQVLNMFLKMTCGESVGMTNTVEVTVNSAPNEGDEIQPRSALETLINSLNLRISNQNAIISELDGIVERKQSEITSLNTEIEGLQTAKSSLEAQIATAQGNISELQGELAEVNGLLADYRQAVTDKQSEIDALNNEKTAIQAFIQELNEEIERELQEVSNNE